MKNIKKGSIKYLIELIVIISICGMILYPLFDVILCKLTTSEFAYSFKNHVTQPIVAAFITGSVLWVVDRK